jgi:sortase (surface protein transpeptidase)
VDADALGLATDDEGRLEVPPTAQGVGWYSAGPVPGEVGPAVFAGHVDLDGRLGVFADLARMQPGQQVSVVRPDGRPVTFVVDRVEQHAKDAFPTDAVYGPTDAPELRLITCGGSFDRRRGSYRDNVIVFARLA